MGQLSPWSHQLLRHICIWQYLSADEKIVSFQSSGLPLIMNSTVYITGVTHLSGLHRALSALGGKLMSLTQKQAAKPVL